MKQFLLIIAAVACNFIFIAPLPAQTDSPTVKKNDSLVAVIAKKDLQISKLDSVIKSNAPKTDTTGKPVVAVVCSSCAVAKLGFKQWLLVFLPALFLLLLGYYFIKWIKKDGFKLADALSATQASASSVTERRTDPANPVQPIETTTTTEQEPVRSASRFLAFFTGLAAIIIAICLVTYYAYFAIGGCNAPPNYEQLWKILAGLGIGVIPYGVNVWNKNTKENPPSGN